MISKTASLLFFSLLLSLSVSAQKHECAPVMNTSLFNGKDLNMWDFYLKDPAVDSKSVFYAAHAAIHIKGDPFGYMRTQLQFSNYKLHLEWSWPSEASNSGVFLQIQKPDTIWPTCFEVQLMAGNAGDLICMGKADMNERTDKSKIVIPKRTASNEVPVGEWNTLDVVCSGNTIEVYVNGTLQNKATGINITKGFIALQSEGKDIEFRNVYVTKLE
jgi:hypothetical protein